MLWTNGQNQKSIRSERYQGLMDAAASDHPMNVGMKIILPATALGSPHFYPEAFQDAMSIVGQLGKPNLFITFTYNPKWPEIKSALNPGEHTCDRPDLSCRVFKQIHSLMDDILKKEILGWYIQRLLSFRGEACHMHTSCLSWTGSINPPLQLSLMISSVQQFQIGKRIHYSTK